VVPAGKKRRDAIIRAMAKSSRENEIKLAFPSPELAIRRLLQAGATEIRSRLFEDNVLFDFPDRALARSDRLLRLRRSGDETVLTFKGPVAGEHRYKLRTEHESAIADGDAMTRILTGLGFEPVYRYQKFRSTFRLDALEAVVDETPLGTFVELEGAPDDIDRVAVALGATADDYITATYRELHERDAAARGKAVGDLLMGSPGESR
jgi:adenylate cyclase class 2